MKRVLDSRNWETWVEPTTPTIAGIRRPDLVVAKSSRAVIIDTSVCADANAASLDDV